MGKPVQRGTCVTGVEILETVLTELNNSIPKQVIKDKIKELSNAKGSLSDTIVANAKTEILFELLGE